MNVSSLTNRIFFATALLAVLSIAAAVYIVNRAVTRQGDRELQRGIEEAATLVDEYRKLSFEAFTREAQLIADLPRLKAAVDTRDPETVLPVAREYQSQIANADLFAIADKDGRILARLGGSDVADEALVAAVTPRASTAADHEAFWPERQGILLIKSVPIWIDPQQPALLGTLILGASLDNNRAAHFKKLTNSEIAFGVNGAIRAATLPTHTWPSLAALLSRPGASERITLDGEEYLAFANALGPPGPGGQPMSVVLRSQTEQLRFLNQLHTQLGATAVVAVFLATLFGYAIARTVTRPLGVVTSTMREMAASGDLSRRIPVREGQWQDEDARLLTTTFNSMTDAIERFQREATQRERLSSLGRLSTVVAHEIRNPLMIIKTSLRSLRREGVRPEQVQAAAGDIDEEITRLNRIVTEVLDFARPIKFELGSADLNALARDAVHAAEAAAGCTGIRLTLDPGIQAANVDAGRLRQALVNIIGNAIQAVGEAGAPVDGRVQVRTARLDGRRAAITVTDKGGGIPPEDLPRIFDPFFTTRRTGTGIGLAISRNIIEGLGGRIVVASERDRGTEVRIELPLDAATA
ncbi:MAG TPA: ATP-binding protein [Vicinamibacterales bacterium]|nr:ATP-binding protein [Vicinamibacterales bacterium]